MDKGVPVLQHTGRRDGSGQRAPIGRLWGFQFTSYLLFLNACVHSAHNNTHINCKAP